MSLAPRATLGDVNEFVIDGTHGSPKRSETGVPVLSAMNVRDGSLIFDTNRFAPTAEYDAFKKRYQLEIGDFLLTIVGTIGRAAVVDRTGPVIFQRSVAMMRPRTGELYSRYLYHFSQSPDFRDQLAKYTNQSSQAGIYLKKLKDVELPLPPLAEQERIAAILDQADALRRRRRDALALLDTLTQSVFVEMFGDPVSNPNGYRATTLKEEADKIDYGLTASAREDQCGPKFLRITDIQNDAVEWGDVPFCEADKKKIAKATLQSGDLVFARTGATTGKSFLVCTPPDGAVFASYLIRVRGSSSLQPQWLRSLFRTSYYWSYINHNAKGAAQGGVNSTSLGAFKMPLPPMAEQMKFADLIQHVETRRSELQTHLTHLDTLFASLQSRAFAGDL